MNQGRSKLIDKAGFLSPVKVSFGFLTFILLVNGAILFTLLWNYNFEPNTTGFSRLIHVDPIYIGIFATFLITLGAWLLVIYRFKKFYDHLLENDSIRMAAEDALKNSEAKVRELLENANDLIYTTDLAGNFTSLNKAGEILTGFSKAEACQKNVADIIAPEHLGLAGTMTEQKLTDNSITRYELEIISKSNDRITIELSSRLIFC